jgi:hypothetical protein
MSWMGVIRSGLFQLRRALRRRWPGPYRWIRDRLSPYRWPVAHLLLEGRPVIRSGPFQGMSYLLESSGSRLAPKLTGSYEAEIQPLVEQILATPPACVLNIGSGEGYYAVGFAWRMPQVPTIAFECDAQARELCQELARLNQVEDNLTQLGPCTREGISHHCRPGALVFCDCEGAELDLLDPHELPCLAQVSLLVELHDCLRPGVTATLQQRFAATHHFQLIAPQPRRAEDYPALRGLAPWMQRLALYESAPNSILLFIGVIWCHSRAKREVCKFPNQESKARATQGRTS